MVISRFWFTTRLNIICSILLEFSLFIFINRYSDFDKDNTLGIVFNSLFLIYWILSSYIIGRYHVSYKDIISIIKNIFLSLINFFIYFSFSYYIFYITKNIRT